MDDELLIEKVLYHLDWEDIMRLFEIYPKTKIKEVWKITLCPLGRYFGRMNYFYAAVLFDIKKPERYIRIQRNKFIKNKINAGEWIISQNKTSF